jgi:hypothetical protein
MTEFWSRCEGQVVNSYRLDKYLNGSGAGAVYSIEYPADTRPAAIKLMQVETAESQRRLDTWAEISRLSHPSLIGLFESGYCEIEGVPLLYVVMERPEGNLAGVLPERALTDAEAREMLGSTLDALAYLQEHGFVHGGVNPSNVIAIGDEIKLASDCITRSGEARVRDESDLCPAPELWDGTVSSASDVWSLGVTLVQALTQRPPELVSAESSGAVIPKSLPEPFFDIARHCLRQDPRSRWTVPQIIWRLRGPQRVVPIKPPKRESPRSWIALYAIAGAITVAVVLMLLVGRDRGKTQIVAPPPAAVPAPVSQRVEATPPEAPRQPQAPSNNWFVVVATYAQQKDAEKRAQTMAGRWQRFKIEIYEPPVQNQKPYYVVVIGSNLSQKAAAALQERARTAGLARDAFITRFSR